MGWKPGAWAFIDPARTRALDQRADQPRPSASNASKASNAPDATDVSRGDRPERTVPSTEQTSASHAWDRLGRQPVGLWLAAAFALSPAVVFTLREGQTVPFHALSLLWPILILRGEWVGRAGAGRPKGSGLAAGAALLLVGIGIGLLGTISNVVFLARAGIPVAVLGLARLTGLPRLRYALLAAWLAVPPTTLYLMGSPWLETTLAGFAAGLIGLGDGQIVATGTVIRLGEEAIFLQPFHGGLGSLWLGAGLGLYVALRELEGERWSAWLARTVAGRVLLGALMGAILHGVAVVAATALLAAGAERAGQFGLDAGGTLAAVGLGIVLGECRSASRRIQRGSQAAARPRPASGAAST
jgi:hypothetical protein